MLKNLFAVIGGFVLWSALWIGTDFTLLLISPDWYGNGLKNSNTVVLLIGLLRTVFISFVSGYTAALIAKPNITTTVLLLGVLLLAFGIWVQAQFWNAVPLWYHLIFLGLLIPVTLFGGIYAAPKRARSL
jgi:hypothetical protein